MSSEAYKHAKGGRLKIGGKEVELKKKKKNKRKLADGEKGTGAGEEAGKDPETELDIEEELEIKTGTGRITSSGLIVTGYDTRFLAELKVNDALIITHPTTLTEETRIIKMIVSDKGMSISSPFSTDLISTTSFRYIHPPTNDAVEENPEERKRRKAEDDTKQAFGTYGSSSKVVYRVKKGGAYGGYKIVTEDAEGELSRTELLEKRMQFKSDRHAC